jgi:hypothetical protein
VKTKKMKGTETVKTQNIKRSIKSENTKYKKINEK